MSLLFPTVRWSSAVRPSNLLVPFKCYTGSRANFQINDCQNITFGVLVNHSSRSFSSCSKTFFNRIKSRLYFGLRWAATGFISGAGDMHSEKHVLNFSNMKIIGLPALQDNFMYLVIEKASMQAIVVDPVEPETVMKEIRRENCTLSAVLTTHHHWDHASGNPEMVKKYRQECPNAKVEVYGGDTRVDGLTKEIDQDDVISLGSIQFHCLHTPCHTSGHICYFVPRLDPSQPPIVFSGDTLFIAGCGRFFEGTAEQMHSALIGKLGALPADTLVFCGHEYTVGNLKFAVSVDPTNQKMKDKLSWAMEQRKTRKPTFPSTIGEEKEINPFMRCIKEDIQRKLGARTAIDCMAKLRQMKDSFKA